MSGATIKQSTETIDGEEWSCVTISGLSSTEVSTAISEEEVDGKDSLVLTIPMDDLTSGSSADDLTAYGYTVSQLKALGLEMTIAVTMPNTVTSNVGDVSGNTVTIDLLELMYSDSAPENIIISSPVSSGSNMTMIIVGVVAVVAVAAGVYIFMNKKKNPDDDFDIQV
ncbi:MAG: hypothetical protein LUF02_11400 [Erysipelotrichaceae bacterium]|nr:hypothetical protein [Erysipelotrichaceae bacterium]